MSSFVERLFYGTFGPLEAKAEKLCEAASLYNKLISPKEKAEPVPVMDVIYRNPSLPDKANTSLSDLINELEELDPNKLTFSNEDAQRSFCIHSETLALKMAIHFIRKLSYNATVDKAAAKITELSDKLNYYIANVNEDGGMKSSDEYKNLVAAKAEFDAEHKQMQGAIAERIRSAIKKGYIKRPTMGIVR